MIVVNNQHTVTLSQTTVRLVTCDECDTEYVYQLSREADGIGNSLYFLDESGAKRRAERKAKEQLTRKMRRACEAVPCPRCGHYQRHMLGRARSQAAFKWWLLAAGALVLAVGGLVLALSTRAVAIGLGLGGLSLLAMAALGVVALVTGNSYDPNRQPEEERLRIAEERAIRRKDFERAVADEAAAEFTRYCKGAGKKKKRRFEMPVWADRGQLKDADRLTVRLPVGRRAEIQLRKNSQDGDEFPFYHDVDGREIEIVCVLNVFTRTQAD